MAPQKDLCACGCGHLVYRSTERAHLNGRGPAGLSASILAQNSWLSPGIQKRQQSRPQNKCRIVQASELPRQEIEEVSLLIGDAPGSSVPDSFVPDVATTGSTAERSAPFQYLANAVQTRWGQGQGDEDSESNHSDMSSQTGSEWGSDSECGDFNMFVDDSEDDAAIGQPGISIWEQLGEDFEAEAAAVAASQRLDENDMALLRAFNLKVESYLPDHVFDKFQYAFPHEPLSSLKVARTRIANLSGFQPVYYDCCINSCVCYTGPYENLTACPNRKCGAPRYDASGKPRKQYRYFPIIPRLRALSANTKQAEAMRYRAFGHSHEDGKLKDVFDSAHYRNLLKSFVTVNEEQLPFWFFSDPRDIALGLSTDGFCPFKKRKQTAWPIILFNYNLPPEVRFLKKNIIVVAIIPGPKKPWDADSYLWPVIAELIQLAIGVTAYDPLTGALFLLHAYLILVFGDIPAISMLMRMKGVNAIHPCRACLIEGVRVPSGPTTYYIPLDRRNHPDSPEPTAYDPLALPLRTHEQFMQQAREVQFANSDTTRERLAKKYGIKGIPLLSTLSSLSFPLSFPQEFMHLIWENLLPNLILLWTATFKDVDHSNCGYVLEPSVWDAIGEASAAACKTIPSAFGTRVPNVATKQIPLTAEMRSVWTLYLAPVLLRRRFKNNRFYEHFVQLVRLLNICLQFEITDEEVDEITDGFAEWVKEYERIYYQYDPRRLPMCPLTIHSLLHIGPGIKLAGPVWAYWAFPMERFCGDILPAIKNRRFPFTNLDNFVTDRAHLTQIKLMYELDSELALKKSVGDDNASGFHLPNYSHSLLLPPRRLEGLSNHLWNKVAAALATWYGKSIHTIRHVLPNPETKVLQFGKVRRLGGGDIIHAAELVKSSNDTRDATYCRYQLLVDRHARQRRRTPEFDKQDFYGQLLRIFVLTLPASDTLGTDQETTHCLAAIRPVKPNSQNTLGMKYYVQDGPVEVVDLNCIQCVIGRVPDRGKWAIIDRSGTFAQAEIV